MIGDIRPVRERPAPLSVLLLCLLVWLCAMFQIGFLNRLPLLGSPIELTLVVVCMIGWRKGALLGAVTGMVGGYLLDSLSSTGISLCPLLLLAAGVLMGMLAERLFHHSVTYLIALLPVGVAFSLFRALMSEAATFGGKARVFGATLLGIVLAAVLLELPALVRYYKKRK